VRERQAIARVEVSGGGIDAQGTRFELGPDEGGSLPLLSGDLGAAQEALAQTVEAGLEVSGVHAEKPNDIRIELRGAGLRLRIGDEPELSLARWKRLRARLSLAEIGAREVDTRFRGQVVLRDAEGTPPSVVAAEGN